MRTSVWQIIRFAWKLYKHSARKHLRINQMIINVTPGDSAYYIENEDLINLIGSDGI